MFLNISYAEKMKAINLMRLIPHINPVRTSTMKTNFFQVTRHISAMPQQAFPFLQEGFLPWSWGRFLKTSPLPQNCSGLTKTWKFPVRGRGHSGPDWAAGGCFYLRATPQQHPGLPLPARPGPTGAFPGPYLPPHSLVMKLDLLQLAI